MATPDTVDAKELPSPLGQNVPRVTANGYPTRETLDNEEFIRNWFTNTTVNLQRRLNEVRSDTDQASAAITTETTARTTADAALASQITTVNASVGTVNARLTDEISARATAVNALSQRVTTTETTLGGHTASITVLQQSVSGIAVRFGVTGFIGGQSGGFVFTGVQRNDGGNPFLLEIQSNVIINGNVVINGTLTTAKAAANAWTDAATGSGIGTTFSMAVFLHGGAKAQVRTFTQPNEGYQKYFAAGTGGGTKDPPTALITFVNGVPYGRSGMVAARDTIPSAQSEWLAMPSTSEFIFNVPVDGVYTILSRVQNEVSTTAATYDTLYYVAVSELKK